MYRELNKNNHSQPETVRGSVFIEFILVLPLLIVTILMLFDLGQRQYYRTLFSAAAERATSYAAVAPNMEHVDLQSMNSEQVIIETKQRALSLLQSAGIPVHLGAWEGGENYKDHGNGSPPSWAWLNNINIILPEDPDDTKSLSDMLSTEPIILELEGFYARTFTGLGPARFLVRRATYRELSQTTSNPLSADAERPCPGAIDSRYGFSNGECYCKLDGTGLTDTGGDCNCAEVKQHYNATSGKCECPGAPTNAIIDSTTCDVTCVDRWVNLDGEPGCESCPEPYTQSDPLTGTCGCSSSQRDACLAIPGQFDSSICECTNCPGSEGNESRFVTDGSCGCKPAAELCDDGRMTVSPTTGCSCVCPNNFFDLVGESGSQTCECNVDRLIETCGEAQFVDVNTCACTNCDRSGELRSEGDPKVCLCAPCIGGTFKSGNDSTTKCAECISCDDSRFQGDFVANPDENGPPCVCPLTCDGENVYLDSENNGAAGGRCECLSCEGQEVVNEQNTGCYCDKATLFNECVGTPGSDSQREFDPVTACDCGAPCPKDFVVNTGTGRCECPQSKVDSTECPEGSTFSTAVCRCVGNCDTGDSSDDYDPDDPSSCHCDHEAKRAECHAAGMPYSEGSCSCAGNCWDLDSKYPHWDPATSRCYCNKDKYIQDNALDCEGKVWSQDSCACGTASCTGSTPDYDGDELQCVCNKSEKEGACKIDELTWDANRCDCGAPCPDGDFDYNESTMKCVCPAARKTSCIEAGQEFKAENCTCGGNCIDQDGKNAVGSDGKCYCDRTKNAQLCSELDPPQAIGSNCGCGGSCGGATPDLVDGSCTCNRTWSNGRGDGTACDADQYFDSAACACKFCGDHATPGSNANRDCVCTSVDCPPGMEAYPADGISCECACPPGTITLSEGFSPGNRCMPVTEDCQAVGDCYWNGSEWIPTGTE